MTRHFSSKCITLSPVLILALLLLFLASPAVAEGARRDNPLSSIKTVMLDHFLSNGVVVTDMQSYRRATYTLSPEVRYTRNRQDIEQSGMFVGSIIKVFILDGAVVEIELIQESS